MSYGKQLLGHEIKRLKGLVTDREAQNERFAKMDVTKDITAQVDQNKKDMSQANKLIKELEGDVKKL